MEKEKTFIVLAFVVGILVSALFFGVFVLNDSKPGFIKVISGGGEKGEVKTVIWKGDDAQKNVNLQFKSFNDLVAFLKTKSGVSGVSRNEFGGMLGGDVMMATTMEAAVVTGGVATKSASFAAGEFSTTNIQVEGVDEPDIMKNDDRYIYSLSDNRVIISEVFPASEMKVLSEINFASEGYADRNYDEGYSSENVRNIFINDDKLVVFLNSYVYEPYSSIRCLGSDYCGGESESFSVVNVYDISDRSKPVLERSIRNDGNYVDARMIGDYVYFVSSKSVNPNYPVLPIYWIDGARFETAIDKLYYLGDNDDSYVFSSVSSLNIESGDFNNEVYLIGYTTTLYVSENNIYLTSTEYMDNDEYQSRIVEDAVLPLLSDSVKDEVEDIMSEEDYGYNMWSEIGRIVEEYYDSLEGEEKISFNETLIADILEHKIDLEYERVSTNVYKISIDKGDVSHEATGRVPGRVLNQFSMDEFDSNFRIATTTGNMWWWGGTRVNQTNGVYVLDENLNLLGGLGGLASGESIHSARFMGNRLYLVTFRRTDPLFVIDLSDSGDLKVLGELKITGVSEYLHPYDENHIIGIGQDASDDGVIRGMKISLFDVSDVSNPVEKAKYTIGERGTYSPILNDHKVFLFDKEKNLMVIPVSVSDGSYRNYWNGAYVFNIDSNGIDLRGKISHDLSKTSYYRGSWRSNIQRSLYMDDILYTVSQAKIMANDLVSLNKINEVVIAPVIDDKVVFYYAEEKVSVSSGSIEIME